MPLAFDAAILSRIRSPVTSRSPAGQRSVLAKLLVGVTIAADQICIKVDRAALARILELGPPDTDQQLELITGASKVREGKATRLVLTDPAAISDNRDSRLVALLAEARATRDMVLAAPDRSLREIAAEQGRCRHRIAKLGTHINVSLAPVEA